MRPAGEGDGGVAEAGGGERELYGAGSVDYRVVGGECSSNGDDVGISEGLDSRLVYMYEK